MLSPPGEVPLRLVEKFGKSAEWMLTGKSQLVDLVFSADAYETHLDRQIDRSDCEASRALPADAQRATATAPVGRQDLLIPRVGNQLLYSHAGLVFIHA